MKLDTIYQLIYAYVVNIDKESLFDGITVNTNEKMLGGYLMIRLFEGNLVELKKVREVS